MAKPVELHHPKLGKTATVPSERVAKVLRRKGWVAKTEQKPEPKS